MKEAKWSTALRAGVKVIWVRRNWWRLPSTAQSPQRSVVSHSHLLPAAFYSPHFQHFICTLSYSPAPFPFRFMLLWWQLLFITFKTTWSARYSHNINKLHTKCYEIPYVPLIEANYFVMLSHAWSRVDPIYYSSNWIIPVFLIKMQKLYISILIIQNQSGPPFSFLVRFDLKNLFFPV